MKEMVISSEERKGIPPNKKSPKMQYLSQCSYHIWDSLMPIPCVGRRAVLFSLKEGHTECFTQEWKAGRCGREKASWLIGSGTNTRRRRGVTEAVHRRCMSVSCYVCNWNKRKQLPGNKPHKQNKETKPHSGTAEHLLKTLWCQNQTRNRRKQQST